MADEPKVEPKTEEELVPVYGPDILTYAGDDPATEAQFRQGPLLGFEPAVAPEPQAEEEQPPPPEEEQQTY